MKSESIKKIKIKIINLKNTRKITKLAKIANYKPNSRRFKLLLSLF
jgi:hypothetical protein